MKKINALPFIAVLTAASLIFLPVKGEAGSADIQKQIDQIAKQEETNKQKQQENEQKQGVIKGQKKQTEQDVEQLNSEIAENGKQKTDLENKITDISLNLVDVRQQKAEAEQRLEARNNMLKSRVRLMYMNGSVSYLDVLLSATSFSDFLDRFQNMKTIVNKDEEILAANKADKDTIAEREVTIAAELAKQQDLLDQKTAVELTLQKQVKQKEVTIASLDKQEQNIEDSNEDYEAEAQQLVKKKQELYSRLAEEKRKEEAKKNNGKPAAAKPVYAGGKLGWPLTINGTISSEFGYRIDPIKKVNKLHKGLDIAAPKGTPVLSADDGTVILAGWVNGYGNTVVVDHNNGLVTWYGHMSAISVKEGVSIKRGGKVGEVGSTGDSTGNHLHFEVHDGDDVKNPRSYLGI